MLYYLHLTNKETRDHRGKVTFPGSHSCKGQGQDSNVSLLRLFLLHLRPSPTECPEAPFGPLRVENFSPVPDGRPQQDSRLLPGSDAAAYPADLQRKWGAFPILQVEREADCWLGPLRTCGLGGGEGEGRGGERRGMWGRAQRARESRWARCYSLA